MVFVSFNQKNCATNKLFIVRTRFFNKKIKYKDAAVDIFFMLEVEKLVKYIFLLEKKELARTTSEKKVKVTL